MANQFLVLAHKLNIDFDKYSTMKKHILFLIALLLSLSTFGQSDYSRGFQNGYKIGYCYNEFGCIPPIPPLSPLPRIRESQDNYQEGYNRGFKQGLEDKQAKRTSSSSGSDLNSNYTAPFLGESSHDPLEFARSRTKTVQNSAAKIQNEQSENFKIGMDRYSIKMEGWDDQKGYKELSGKISDIQDIFIKIHLSGLNIISPQTSDELKIYKAMNEAMDNIRSKYYVWQSQKNAYRAAEKIIYEQIIIKESERTIDIEATRANMNKLLETEGILNRTQLTENLIVSKPILEEVKAKNTFSTVTDLEGNVYKTILIGTQTWMSENLKSTKYNNGSSIPLITDSTSWIKLSTPAYCWYNNDPVTYKVTYGALYNWYTVNTRKLCPSGWHVPNNIEWRILIDYLGGEDVAGGKLRQNKTAQSNSNNTAATNESGFTALLGSGRFDNGTFFPILDGDFGGYWWSSTDSDVNTAWYISMFDWVNDVNLTVQNKELGFSVRCVMD